MREIERLTATNHDLATMKSEQIFSLRCHAERAVGRSLPRNLDTNDAWPKHSSQHLPSEEVWWSRTGSNRRPPACKAGALPAELRPLDKEMVGLGGLEPPTSRLSSARSNQLSYKPGTIPCWRCGKAARPEGTGWSLAKKEKRRRQTRLRYARRED